MPMYRTLFNFSRKFSNRFFLLDDLSHQKMPPRLARAMAWLSLRRPSIAEDWLPVLRFIGPARELILVDIGANVGDFTLGFARFFNVVCAYCYEPIPSTCKLLRKNLLRANCRTVVLNQAVNSQASDLSMNIYSDSALNSSHVFLADLVSSGERAEPVDRLKVIAKPIDSSLIQGGDIFLKIDVQGMEEAVVAGCTDILERCIAVLVEASFLPEYAGSKPSFSGITSVLMQYNLYPVYFHDYGNKTSLYPVERDVLYVRQDLLCRAYDEA